MAIFAWFGILVSYLQMEIEFELKPVFDALNVWVSEVSSVMKKWSKANSTHNGFFWWPVFVVFNIWVNEADLDQKKWSCWMWATVYSLIIDIIRLLIDLKYVAKNIKESDKKTGTFSMLQISHWYRSISKTNHYIYI